MFNLLLMRSSNFVHIDQTGSGINIEILPEMLMFVKSVRLFNKEQASVRTLVAIWSDKLDMEVNLHQELPQFLVPQLRPADLLLVMADLQPQL